MKMIITPRRNPALSRAGFFNHLRYVHWPLIDRLPEVRAALAGYVQNHALGPDSPPSRPGTPRVATERDSVIELVFPSPENLARLVSLPDYLAEVRPDEARFNDLPSNIMVMTDPITVFAAPSLGRCKRFDFLAARPGADRQRLWASLDDFANRLALDPRCTGLVDRLTLNRERPGGDGTGFGSGSFACVVETWAGDFARTDAVDVASIQCDDLDLERSFSVYAVEHVMIAPVSPEDAA